MRTRLALLLPVALLLSGCFAPEKGLADRSAIQQQVTTAAIRAATGELDFTMLDPEQSYQVEVTGLQDTDNGWIRASLQERLQAEGFQVVDASSDAPRTRLEAVVAYGGTDLEGTLLGLPIIVPGLPVAFGSISLYASSTTTGRARIGLRIWKDGALQQVVPEVQASRYFKNETFLTFIGPFISTDLAEFKEPGEEQEPEAEEVGEDGENDEAAAEAVEK